MPPLPAHPRLTGVTASFWRCGDINGAFPLFSGIGAGLYPGRWNMPQSPMIYTSETFSTALLEKLAHLNSILPSGMHGVEVLAPDGLSIEYFDLLAVPNWLADQHATKAFGDGWFQQRRSLLLRVPSVPAAALDCNMLINPNHDDFVRLVTKPPFPVHWDRRLFQAVP